MLSFVASVAILIISTFTVSAEIENKLGLKFYGSFLYSENSKTLELRDSSLKIEGIYPYIASSKNGSSEKSQFLDMLILNGSSKSYPDAPNYYLKISKSWVLENLN